MDEPSMRVVIAQQALGPGETLVAVVKVMEHLVKRARNATKLRLIGVALRDRKPLLVTIKIMSQGGYKLHKMWRLEDLEQVVGDSGREKRFYFSLVLNKRMHRYSTDTMSRRDEFLWALICLSRRLVHHAPELRMIDVGRLETRYQHLTFVDDGVTGDGPSPASVLASPQAIKPFQEIDWDVTDAAALERRLMAELLGLESANVYALVQSDQELSATLAGIDTTLTHLDAMDNVLRAMSDRLLKLGEDMGSIESKDADMRRQAVNQQALLNELQTLLSTLTLPPESIATLLDCRFDTPEDIEAATAAAEELQTALAADLTGLDEMTAVVDRMNDFREYRRKFSVALHAHLERLIEAVVGDCMAGVRSVSTGSGGAVESIATHEHTVHAALLPFVGLTKWLKALDPQKLSTLQDLYVKQMSRVYRRQIKEVVDSVNLSQLARAAGDVADYSQSTSAAINKRRSVISKTALDMIRTTIDLEDLALTSLSTGNLGQHLDRLPPAPVAYGAVVEAVLPAVNSERAFCSALFHHHVDSADGSAGPVASSSVDITDLLQDAAPASALGSILNGLFELMFSELTALIEGSTKLDPTLAVAFAVRTDELRQESLGDNTFLSGALSALVKTRCVPMFERFVTKEVETILANKVSVKKRTGVLPAFTTFPQLVNRLEKFFVPNQKGDAVDLVTRAYTRIAEALLQSLPLYIERGPVTTKDAALREALLADEKDRRNANIIVAENCHHLFSSIQGFKVACLEGVLKDAKQLYEIYLQAYVDWAVKRTTGKLWDFFDGVETLLLTQREEEVAFNLAFNKAALRKAAGPSAGKDLRRNLEATYKSIGRHFSPEEGLFQVVWHNVQQDLMVRVQRFGDLAERCYSQPLVELVGYSLADVLSFLTDISRQMAS